MLDSDTKRRIDTARDILVGKVPDPKSQVEQITIALIYKFMDDMDAESEELGGQRKFFTGDFARYGWAKLMRSGLGGHETLNLYAEAIARMPENPGIPLLFRDIFKNAFLPYRDPETLRSFLKIIDEFSYDHSERLGDAFEYLLSVLGSQGDAGQFRTPRHIIDFIVSIVDPRKNETILDPACGTAGFLISAYKHILRANTGADGVCSLTPDERAKLAQGIRGYDISPDMVRLSLVNLYLHGFTDPHIAEYDTLTSQERWNETADVILANPPFMSPRGGIKPHTRFSVQSKRSEVLFVDYMAEHLNANGRAGIIVPEGIIFQSGSAYKQLREVLLKESLIGVISLPSGVFQPYSGVKTSILILDKNIARSNPHILFSEAQAIGVSLGIKRTITERNDLPHIADDYAAYYAGQPVSSHSWLAQRSTILADDCNLNGTRYRPVEVRGETRVVRLADVCSLSKGNHSSTKTEPGPYPLIVTAEDWLTSSEYQFEGEAVCVPLISSTGHGRASLKRIHFASERFALANLLAAVQPNDLEVLSPRFLYFVLDFQKDRMAGLMNGAANVSMKVEDLAQFQIPVPPIEVQRDIVAEIDGYQKVIDGARAVLGNYRPRIPIHPEWPQVQISSVSSKITKGSSPNWQGIEYCSKGDGVLFITSENVGLGKVLLESPKYVERRFNEIEPKSILQRGDVLTNIVGASIGRTAIFNLDEEANVNQAVCVIRPNPAVIDSTFLMTVLNSPNFIERLVGNSVENARANVSMGVLGSMTIPLPTIEVQQAIVAEIEAEQTLVAANRELIALFEKKIHATLARVWGEDESVAAEA